MSFFSGGKTSKKLLSTVLWLPVGVVFTNHFYTLKFIQGRSMQPNLNPEPLLRNDLAIFDRMSIHLYHKYNHGDIVALWSPTDANKLIVKRIVALEGDIVRTLPPYPNAELRIPEGHVWVEGDDPFQSTDSNTFGPVSLGVIDSKLFLILWPLHRILSIDSIGLRKENNVRVKVKNM